MARQVTTKKSASVHDLTYKDQQSLYYMDCECLTYSWSQPSWSSTLESQNVIVRFLMIDNAHCGFSLYQHEENYAHLLKVAINKDNRGFGYGKWLMQQDLAYLKEMDVKKVFLEVESSNKAGLALYESIGFQSYHLAKKYYHDGCDALKMSLTLLP